MNLTLPRGEAEINRYVRELSRDALQLHPPDGGWSRQQVVEHLILAYNASGSQIEERLTKGRPSKRGRSFSQAVSQFLMLRFAYFPPGRKSPENVHPDRSQLPPMDGSALSAAFHMSVMEVSDWIDRAEAEWGRRKFVATHPVLGPMTAPQWREFHALHALHHARQLERIQGALEAN